MKDNMKENSQECDGEMEGCAICKEHPGWGQHAYTKTYSSRITDKMLADAVESWTNAKFAGASLWKSTLRAKES